MIIYQLFAHGQCGVTGSLRNVASKIVFKTEKKALAHKNEFIKRLTTPLDKYDLNYLDKRSLRIFVKPITLAD